MALLFNQHHLRTFDFSLTVKLFLYVCHCLLVAALYFLVFVTCDCLCWLLASFDYINNNNHNNNNNILSLTTYFLFSRFDSLQDSKEGVPATKIFMKFTTHCTMIRACQTHIIPRPIRQRRQQEICMKSQTKKAEGRAISTKHQSHSVRSKPKMTKIQNPLNIQQLKFTIWLYSLLSNQVV